MEPDGPTTIKPWMIGAGVAVLIIGYVLFKRRSSSSSSPSALNYGPYGPPATGTGVLEPIILNSGGGSAPTSTISNTSGGASPVPAAPAGSGATPTNAPTPGDQAFTTWLNANPNNIAWYDLQQKRLAYIPGPNGAIQTDPNNAAFNTWAVTPGAARYYDYQTNGSGLSWLQNYEKQYAGGSYY